MRDERFGGHGNPGQLNSLKPIGVNGFIVQIFLYLSSYIHGIIVRLILNPWGALNLIINLIVSLQLLFL